MRNSDIQKTKRTKNSPIEEENVLVDVSEPSVISVNV
jgi:hypothetical protein